ncbi:MAG: hypothetical protein DMG76_05400 [Acidobacteria bacterium]|nr:MAG: hypothetical protein DMG76_05400 [Acidobacteriota bacterium]
MFALLVLSPCIRLLFFLHSAPNGLIPVQNPVRTPQEEPFQAPTCEFHSPAPPSKSLNVLARTVIEMAKYFT